MIWDVMRSLFFVCFSTLAYAQTINQPARGVTDPGVVTTRQAITPAGVPSIFQGRVYGVAWTQSNSELWVLHASNVYRIDWKNNRVLAQIPHGGTPGAQAIQFDPVSGKPLVANSVRDGSSTKARVAWIEGESVKAMASGLGRFQPGAFAIASKPNHDGKRVAVVPLVWENKLAVIDMGSGEVIRQFDTGIAPFAAAVNKNGSVAYVSNLGGRPPKDSELFASPMQKPQERVTVDTRGIASTGTVTRLDLTGNEASKTIAVGLHPTGIAWDEERNLLYISNGNSESVSIIDTANDRVIRTIEIQPFSQQVRGISPTSIAISRDGKSVYVTCGGINAVAVIEAASGKLTGLIPTGWYPNGASVSADGKYLAVSSLLGAGSAWRDAPAKRFVHSYRGSIAVLPIPDDSQLASYTTAVAENNRLRLAGSNPAEVRASSQPASPTAVPTRSGDPSLIEHVVYIVKENRTYDQVLGGIGKGNGDPYLVMFDEDVTPNQHRLAEEFVLLDNFYATGGNSADGHQWLTQANETEYCLWPGYQGRSYPFDGSDPMAYSSGGFLWDYAIARGKSVRVYGEYAGRMAEPLSSQRIDLLRRWQQGGDFTKEWSIRAPIEPLNKILAAHYPAYTNAIPDVARAQIFLEDLKRFEKEDNLPNLVLLQLPSDHTFGTAPGVSTPKAMVADNDLAVGQVVEALSKSRFWPKMAIFIVEDDAQNGVDHVDGHRTTAFVVSPYVRRGHVDSTFYSHQSMLKTIELILGLPTMSIFDLIATDMRNSFVDTPDLKPYTAVKPKQDLFEVNPPVRALRGDARKGAIASAKMNWSAPDAAPTEKLNRILWGQIKGWNVPYPQIRRAVFSPLAVEIEDEDRDEK